MNTINPFIVQGYRDPEHFCDREQETRTLMTDLANGRNVTLMAPRRYGKSGLIHHAMHLHGKEYVFAYVNLLSTTNQADFVRIFANAIVGVLDTRLEKAASAFASFFRNVRPTMTANHEGEVSFSFEVTDHTSETTLGQVFDYLEQKKDRKIVIAFDEFQQVSKYPETGTEALLRSRIQFLPPNIHFIFAGSQMHLLGEMFASPKRPFYQSTEFLPLGVIPCDRYCEFAERFYDREGREFDRACFEELYKRFDGITWYVQSVLNELWAMDDALVDPLKIDVAVGNLVARRELTFHDLDASQSESARALLRAIAKAGRVSQPTSSQFMSSSGLRAPSTIAGAIRQLSEKELIYKSDDGYMVYDRLFGEYLKRS